MSLLDSLLLSVFGMAVVFIVLVALSLLVRVQSRLITFFTGKKVKKALVPEAAMVQPMEKVIIEAPGSQKVTSGEVNTSANLAEEKKQVLTKPAEKPSVAVSHRVKSEPVKKFTAKINGKVFNAEIEEVEAIIQEGTAIKEEPVVNAKPVQVKQEVKAPVPEKKTAVPPMPASSANDEIITAAVPGIVLEIKTAVGAKVKRGDVLMLLEAMKMENEIVAVRDGTIVQIMTSKGASVTMGMPLIEIQ